MNRLTPPSHVDLNKGAPGFGAEWSANVEKSWWNQARKEASHRMMFEDDPEYDPWGDLEGYEAHAPGLVFAKSAAEMRSRKKWIDDNIAAEETMARGSWGIIAGLAAGVVDPANFIPVPIVRGIGLLRGASQGAAINAGISGATEVARLGVDPTMEASEILSSVSISALLGGALGGASGGFGRRTIDGQRMTGRERQAARDMDQALRDMEYDAPAVFLEGQDHGIVIKRGPRSRDNFDDAGTYHHVNLKDVAGEIQPKLGPDNQYYVYDWNREGWVLQYKSGAKEVQTASTDMQKALGKPKPEQVRTMFIDEDRLAYLYEHSDWQTALGKILDVDDVTTIIRNSEDFVNLMARAKLWERALPRRKSHTDKSFRAETVKRAAEQLQRTRAGGNYGRAFGLEKLMEGLNFSSVANGIKAVKGDPRFSDMMLRLGGDYGWATRTNMAGGKAPPSVLLMGLRHQHRFVQWRDHFDEQWNKYVSGKKDAKGIKVLDWNMTASVNKYQRKLANIAGNKVMTYEQFSDMVGQATFRNDFFQIDGFDMVPEARAAAMELRKVLDEYDADARALGIAPDVLRFKERIAELESEIMEDEHWLLRRVWRDAGGHPMAADKAIKYQTPDGTETLSIKEDGSVVRSYDEIEEIQVEVANDIVSPPDNVVPFNPLYDREPLNVRLDRAVEAIDELTRLRDLIRVKTKTKREITKLRKTLQGDEPIMGDRGDERPILENEMAGMQDEVKKIDKEMVALRTRYGIKGRAEPDLSERIDILSEEAREIGRGIEIEQQQLAEDGTAAMDPPEFDEPIATPRFETYTNTRTIEEEIMPAGTFKPRERVPVDYTKGGQIPDLMKDHNDLVQVMITLKGDRGFEIAESMTPQDKGYINSSGFTGASQLVDEVIRSNPHLHETVNKNRMRRSDKMAEIVSKKDYIDSHTETAPVFRDRRGKIEHYFPRFYKHTYIIENRAKVEKMFTRAFEPDGPDTAAARAAEAVDEILNSDPMDLGQSSANIKFLRERTLEIPNSGIWHDPEFGEMKFTDIIDTNALAVAETYIRRTGAKMEVARAFGDPKMETAIGKMRKDLLDRNFSEAEVDEAIGNLEMTRDAVIGALRTSDPWRWDNRTGRDLMNVTAMSSMGRSMLTAIPEAYRGAMINGMGVHFDTVLLRYLSDLESVRDFTDWMKGSQEISEMSMANANVRQAEMQMGEVTSGGHWAEAAIEKAMPGYFKLVGLTPWTAMMKDMMSLGAGHMAMSRAVRVAEAIKEGKTPKAKDIQILAAQGIDEIDAIRLASMPYEMSPKGNIILPAVKNWKGHDGKLAQRSLMNAIQGEIRRGIVTPSIGDKPLVSQGVLTKKGRRYGHAETQAEGKAWIKAERLRKKLDDGLELTRDEQEFMATAPTEKPKPGWNSESDLLRLPFQFLSYGLAAHNKLVASGLQGRDAQPVMGILGMTMLGIFSVYTKVPDTSWQSMDLEEALLNGYDAAGISGFWFGDLPQMIERASGNRVGLRPMLGVDPRYNKDGAMEGVVDAMGASAGMLLNLSEAFTNTELSATQRAQIIRRVVPYANVLWWNGITRNLATSAGKAFEDD